MRHRCLSRHVTILACLAVIAGCHRPPQDEVERTPPVATPIPSPVGTWSLEPVSPPEQPTQRVWLDLRVDSAVEGRLYGGLLRYMAGDVGIDAGVFPRFDGRLSERGEITIRIGHADRAISGFAFGGRLTGDTIPLDLFAIGPDTVSRAAGDWVLVRVPEPE